MEGNITIGKWSYIGPGSVLVGDITIGDYMAIRINVAIRNRCNIGNYVHIHDMVNIEEGRPFLVNENGSREESQDRLVIGDRVWINHGAIIHGSQIGEGAAIGINASLDYNCRIGRGAIVTNGSACPVGTVVPDNCVGEGVPVTIIKRDITDSDRREVLGLRPEDWAPFTAERLHQRLRGHDVFAKKA